MTGDIWMTSSAHKYWTALEKTPECARRIGIIFGLFATIENQFVDTFRWIANMDQDQARVALESHRHFSSWISYLEGVLKTTQPNWERDFDAGKEFLAAVTVANKIRNKYAHSTYGWTGEPGSELLFVRVFADSLGGQEREEIANVSILDSDILFLGSVIDAMTNYCSDRAAGKPPDLQEIRSAITKAQPVHLCYPKTSRPRPANRGARCR
jgi:hypothetical protein